MLAESPLGQSYGDLTALRQLGGTSNTNRFACGERVGLGVSQLDVVLSSTVRESPWSQSSRPTTESMSNGAYSDSLRRI